MKRTSIQARGYGQWIAQGALAALVATSVVWGVGQAQAQPEQPQPGGSATATASAPPASGSASAPEPAPTATATAEPTATAAPVPTPTTPPPAATASASASASAAPSASASAPEKSAAELAEEEAADRQAALIGGGVSLGVGVVGGVLFGVGFAQYKSALRDPVFDPYKNAYGGGADLCYLASEGDVPKGAVGFNVEDAQKKCDSAEVWRTVGSAALPVGLVLVGMGTYLLAWGSSGGEEAEAEPKTTFLFTPYVGSDSAGAVAAGTF